MDEKNEFQEMTEDTGPIINDNGDITNDGTVAEISISLSNRRREVRSWIFTALAAAALFGFLMIFVAPGVVSGASMEPNYYSGDRFILIRDWVLGSEYDYGEIVCTDYEGSIFIKRVIGKPGDHIVIANGSVYRNDEKLTEDYITQATYCFGIYSDVILGEDEYYLLGDNRGNSLDSRTVGAFTKLEGKPWFYLRAVWFN